jgi:hypothetical protein
MPDIVLLHEAKAASRRVREGEEPGQTADDWR